MRNDTVNAMPRTRDTGQKCDHCGNSKIEIRGWDLDLPALCCVGCDRIRCTRCNALVGNGNSDHCPLCKVGLPTLIELRNSGRLRFPWEPGYTP